MGKLLHFSVKALEKHYNPPKESKECSSGDLVDKRYEKCRYAANESSGMCPRHETLTRYLRKKDRINA